MCFVVGLCVFCVVLPVLFVVFAFVSVIVGGVGVGVGVGVVVVVAFLSRTLESQVTWYVHPHLYMLCTSAGTLHRVRGLRARPFSMITHPAL